MSEEQESETRAVRFYTEEELDAIEEEDPDRAFELARAQALAERSRATGGWGHDAEAHPLPEEGPVREAVDQARLILNRDGGDLELVAVEERVVRVRLKGACVGCPSAPLDLRNVVERMVVEAVPGVARVENVF
ncbi:MAG: NifU family protein [Pseudomonadota bacterium]